MQYAGCQVFSDIGKILENLVFSHLVRLGFTTHVGQMEEKEIDFFAEKEGKRVYIQVAYMMSGARVSDREFGNLLSIPDNYQKMVVSMDTLASGDYQGVKHKHIIDFLSDEQVLGE